MTNSNELKTPYYLFDENVLRRHLAQMDDIRKKYTSDDLRFCYAIKANPFLIPYIDKFVEHFEVCSWGELKLCMQNAVAADKIILSGVNKEPGMIADAVKYGVKIYTVESMNQYDEIVRQAEITNTHIRLLPRLSNGAQFGMDKSCIEEIIQGNVKHPGIEIIGIHYFTGTQKRNSARLNQN